MRNLNNLRSFSAKARRVVSKYYSDNEYYIYTYAHMGDGYSVEEFDGPFDKNQILNAINDNLDIKRKLANVGAELLYGTKDDLISKMTECGNFPPGQSKTQKESWIDRAVAGEFSPKSFIKNLHL